MKVVSLFDGISCGMIALQKAGINVSKYYSFEIDKHAIEISKNNYSKIIRCGDVVNFDFSTFKNVNLLIGNGWTVDVIAHIFRGLVENGD